MKLPKLSLQATLAWIGLIAGYFVTHLWALTRLPVFADEAIYIRWAQLIIDDWQRYLFFALNDGKTPLFIWLLVPFELVFNDPLWAGRFLAVLVGFGQVIATGLLVKVLGGKIRAQWLARVLTAVLPFWYFYHRQALIDGLLTLLLTLTIICTVQVVQTGLRKNRWLWVIGLGLSLGLAILTKLPAVLILPLLPWWVLLDPKQSWRQRGQSSIYLGVGIGIGLGLFASLKLQPAFGQLFSRGGDFLYPMSEMLAGKWQETLPNIPNYIDYFATYSYVWILLLFVMSLFGARKRYSYLLFWSALLFALPMAVMGKVVYARYFMPLMIFITAAVSLFIEEVLHQYVDGTKKFQTKAVVAVVIVLLLANTLASSGSFMMVAVTNPNQLPLTRSDQAQYLTEWSSGHGIPEVEAFIRQQAQTQTVAVATEGFFGTLPDGLLMYFAAQPDPNVFIEGIGQPVRSIPEFFWQRAKGYDKKFLVVNSHRLDMNLPPDSLVLQTCRPFGAPCLQVWDISSL